MFIIIRFPSFSSDAVGLRNSLFLSYLLSGNEQIIKRSTNLDFGQANSLPSVCLHCVLPSTQGINNKFAMMESILFLFCLRWACLLRRKHVVNHNPNKMLHAAYTGDRTPAKSSTNGHRMNPIHVHVYIVRVVYRCHTYSCPNLHWRHWWVFIWWWFCQFSFVLISHCRPTAMPMAHPQPTRISYAYVLASISFYYYYYRIVCNVGCSVEFGSTFGAHHVVSMLQDLVIQRINSDPA